MISACLICGPGDDPERAVASVKPLVDEVVLVSSRTVAGAHFDHDCLCGCGSVAGDILDFSIARNESFRQASGEWRTWLDTDDEIVGAPEDLFSDPKERVLCPYDYAPKSRFYLPRLVSAGESWRYPIHEMLSGGIEGVRCESVLWRHRRTPEATRRSAERNFRLLTHHMTVHENIYRHDARMWEFYGMACLDLGKPIAALGKLERAFLLSRWPDQRANIALALARGLPQELGLLDKVREWAWRAAAERPSWPQVWRTLARIYPEDAPAFVAHARACAPCATLIHVDPTEA